MALGIERRDARLRTLRVPGPYVVEVGATGVATEPHEERGRQPPGRVAVEFGYAEGAGRELGEGCRGGLAKHLGHGADDSSRRETC